MLVTLSRINYITSGQTSENYDYTVSNTMSSVTCGNVEDCYIDCFGSSCEDGVITASSAKNLILTCRGPQACEKLSIVTGPTTAANISCVWAGSSLTISTTLNVNLTCDTQGVLQLHILEHVITSH